MIVFSLLLILVAVTLLVLGLTGGSSLLLIASIVASLLAAITLVVGARQASAARRAAAVGPDPIDLDADPGPAARGPAEPRGPADPAATRRAFRRRAAAEPVSPGASPGSPDHAEAAAYAAGRRGADDSHGADAAAPSQGAPDEPGRPVSAPYGQDAGPVRDSDASHGAAPVGEASQDDGDFAGAPHGDEAQPGRAEQPDYDRAATFIGGARAQDQNPDDRWVRDLSAARAEAASAADASAGDVWADVSAAPADPARAFLPGADGPGFEAGSEGISRGSGLSDEFGEPDPDDPDDEPLPQAVRAADGARVARMDAEVLVVDGRPRYHFADCPHLVGRLTEPLPVAEAVELEFSPCGLCRPVDRLVAATARR